MSDNSFDDLRNIFDTFLEMGGQKFDVERNDVIIATYDGLTNTSSSGEKYIGFHPTCDIQCGDWLITVSYTHLDVYKRQVLWFHCFSVNNAPTALYIAGVYRKYNHLCFLPHYFFKFVIIKATVVIHRSICSCALLFFGKSRYNPFIYCSVI